MADISGEIGNCLTDKITRIQVFRLPTRYASVGGFFYSGRRHPARGHPEPGWRRVVTAMALPIVENHAVRIYRIRLAST